MAAVIHIPYNLLCASRPPVIKSRPFGRRCGNSGCVCVFYVFCTFIYLQYTPPPSSFSFDGVCFSVSVFAYSLVCSKKCFHKTWETSAVAIATTAKNGPFRKILNDFQLNVNLRAVRSFVHNLPKKKNLRQKVWNAPRKKTYKEWNARDNIPNKKYQNSRSGKRFKRNQEIEWNLHTNKNVKSNMH